MQLMKTECLSDFAKLKRLHFFPIIILLVFKGTGATRVLSTELSYVNWENVALLVGSQGEKTGICVSKPNKGNNNVNLNWIDKYKLQNL